MRDKMTIRFARLLCELDANIEATPKEWKSLCESMDLSMEEIEKIFMEAKMVWEGAKNDFEAL